MKTLRLPPFASALLALAVLFLPACGKRETRVQKGNREQVLHRGNGAEPSELDPQVVTGVPEHHIIVALFEGLLMAHPKDLSPQPGMAERWEVSTDRKTYTFFLRDNAVWSNGDRVTADDFVQSYERMLNPKLAAPYAESLFIMEGAKEYNEGTLKDFAQVGVKALEMKKLQITLRTPAAYFPVIVNHYAWFPVPIKVIEKHGSRYDKGNRWTRPENIVTNGPFTLKEWKTNQVIVVAKSETYWDAKTVRLRAIHFYPTESIDADERMFRTGQVHVIYDMPLSKIDAYKATPNSGIRFEPYYGTYFYRINLDPVKGPNPALRDARVRRALALAIDRDAIVKNITRAGEIAAFSYTPEGPGGYHAKAKLRTDYDEARRLLAEAGFPGGKGLPKLVVHFDTKESHRAIAEAVQEMWKKQLGVEVELLNEEWKVYLATQQSQSYMISRSGWIGDYVDPNTFLEIFQSTSGNNNTGWKNPEYDRLIVASWYAPDEPARMELLAQAEAILTEECPIIPIYHYTRDYLIASSVKGWYSNLLDEHHYKYLHLDDSAGPDKPPVLGAAP